MVAGSADEVLENSDVLVVSKKNNEFKELLKRIPDDKTVIDLVRLEEDLTNTPQLYEGICW